MFDYRRESWCKIVTMKRIIGHKYEEIKSLENLLAAWEEFIKNKKKRADVRDFAQMLFPNVLLLHQELNNFSYRHASYEEFHINDPKPRIIHKATVRDRLLHHAVYRVLYPLFDQTFIFDSFSCRKMKGTHKAFKRLIFLSRKESKNYSNYCWVLKCDIKKFFHSIDHKVLIRILSQRIQDEQLLDLLKEIIESFEYSPGKGMPLGNLTSQLFANVYLDPLDKFIKHKLKAKHYIRYADDFLLFSQNPSELLGYLIEINRFLKAKIKLSLHPDKIILQKLHRGIDFVGYVALPHYSLPRQTTVKRIFKTLSRKISEEPGTVNTSLQSYLGYLKHVNAHKLSGKLERMIDYRIEPLTPRGKSF